MKDELRQHYLTMRAEQDSKYLEHASKLISNRFMTLPCYRKSMSIMTYASVGYEVDTFYLIDNMLFDMKKVYLPLCDTKNITMEPSRLHSIDDLVPGAYDIPVPKEHETIPKESLDVCIIPGCVFSKNMHRIGYGKGFYDRFLPDTKMVKVGFCYGFTLVDEIVPDINDVPLDIIITENQTIFAN